MHLIYKAGCGCYCEGKERSCFCFKIIVYTLSCLNVSYRHACCINVLQINMVNVQFLIKFALFDFSKTAIAIDTIINQKKFNEGTDESK